MNFITNYLFVLLSFLCVNVYGTAINSLPNNELELICAITDIQAGNQTPCDSLTNTFTQEVIIFYEDEPATGMLFVNGLTYPITGSPQTITIIGQEANGMFEGVAAYFTADSQCNFFKDSVYQEPQNCCILNLDFGEDIIACSNDSIVLDAGQEGINYTWFQNGFILPDTTYFLNIENSGTYSVDALGPTGCTSSDNINIEINPSPQVQLPEDFAVCEEDSMIIFLNAITNADSLLWYKNGVLIDSVNSQSLLVLETGVYSLTGYLGNCFTSDTISVSIVNKPIVDLGNDTTLCANDVPLVLNAGPGGTAYSWYRNNIIDTSFTTQTYEVTSTGIYRVVVDNSGGCITEDTITVTLNNIPVVLGGNDVLICNEMAENINAFTEADTFTWYFNGDIYSDQSLNPSVSQEGNYTIVGIDTVTGCSNSDTVIVEAVTPPDIDLGADTILCQGESLELMVDSTGLVIWTRNGAFVTDQSSISITTPGLYRVQIISGMGCSGQDSIQVDIDIPPSISLPDSISFCEGNELNLTIDNAPEFIKWYKDGQEIIELENETDISLTETGVYIAEVSNNNVCFQSDTLVLEVAETTNFNLGEDLALCSSDTTQLVSPVMAETYQWYFNGQLFSNNDSITINQEGTYALEVQDENGCSASDTISISIAEDVSVQIPDSVSICGDDEIEIIADSDADQYTWTLNDQLLENENTNLLTLNSAGVLIVEAYNNENCISSDTTIISQEVMPFSELQDAIEICPDETIEIFAGSADNYLWFDNSTNATLSLSYSNLYANTSRILKVTLSNGTGCSIEDSLEVFYIPPIIGGLTTSSDVACNGETILLTASGGTDYEWQTNDPSFILLSTNEASITPDSSFAYEVIITGQCPNDADSLSTFIEVITTSTSIDAGDDDCVIEGEMYQLNASGGSTYNWYDDESFTTALDIPNPSVTPTFETEYFVEITDENGCIFLDSVTICILPDPLDDFKAVTIITPNGDGSNDFLEFIGLEKYPDNILTIYNRWGQIVFEQRGYQSNDDLWDGSKSGQPLPPDTYYYVLKFGDRIYKESLTIIR